MELLRTAVAFALLTASFAWTIPGAVARSSCALARHDCSRKGRRPLTAGGYILPKVLDTQWHICDRLRHGFRGTAAEDLESLYEAAMVNSSLALRPHLPTLLEYSTRAASVLQLGSSDTAWIAIIKGGLQRSGLLYRTELTGKLLDFSQQHDLRSANIRFLEEFGASEMVFFSSWQMDFEGLAAKVARAKFILLHGIKSSGAKEDLGVEFLEQLQLWLDRHRAWQLTEYSTLGAGLAVLSRAERLSNCSETAWAGAQSLASKLLDVRHDYPSPLGATWKVNLEVLRALRRRLAAQSCPDAKAGLQLLELFNSNDPQLRQGLISGSMENAGKGQRDERKFSVGKLESASHPELALLQLYRGHVFGERRNLLEESLARWPHRVEFHQILAADLVLHLREQKQDQRDTDQALSLTARAMQAIRRSFALAHFDRAVVFPMLGLLEDLGRAREAALIWEAVAGWPTAPWDDQRRCLVAAVSVPEVTMHAKAFPGEEFHDAHSEFKFARDYMEAISDELLAEQLNIIRTYSSTQFNGFCKNNGWCEYVFLIFEYCRFLSQCGRVPKTCKAAQKMEQQGLRILRVSLSLAGSPEVAVDDEFRRKVYIQPHASPEVGRMRLSCTLIVSPGTSSTLRIEGEAPRIYREGKCFWFDESMTHEMDFEAIGPDTLRATLYLDALHPGYYEEREVQYYPTEDSLPWWQTILEKMGKPWPVVQPTPRRYLAPPSRPSPWLSLAQHSQKIHADICLQGDFGLLFHENSFWNAGDENRRLVALQLFSRMEILQSLGRQDPDAMKLFYRNRDFTQKDLDQLTENAWVCLALGCKGCEALEMFGLCWADLAPHILVGLLRGFGLTMHLNMGAIQSWFQILGYPFPPPGGYGLSYSEFERIMAEKAAEVQEFLEHN